MLRDFRRAFSQSFDPSFRWVFSSAVLTSAIMLGMASIVMFFAANFAQELGVKQLGVSLNQLLSTNTLAVMFALSSLVMIPLSAPLLFMYRDSMAEVVESVYYPTARLDAAWDLPMTFFSTVRFLCLLVVWYFVLWLIYTAVPLLALFLFWVGNGVLLGREFFFQIAIRQIAVVKVFAIMNESRWQINGAGVVLAFLLSIPVINLMAGALGIAAFTHMINRLCPVEKRGPDFSNEYKRWYSDKPLQDEPQAAYFAATIDHEKMIAEHEGRALSQKYAQFQPPKQSDPDDPTTWANIFSDLAPER